MKYRVYFDVIHEITVDAETHLAAVKKARGVIRNSGLNPRRIEYGHSEVVSAGPTIMQRLRRYMRQEANP